MSIIEISRAHNLDADECRTVAEDLLDQLVAKFGGSVRSEGECYSYRHSTGLKARVDPQAGNLDISVKLTMMTRSFAPLVEQQIQEVLDKHLT